MKRKNMLLVVLLMAVGFAAVSTTLFINGQTKINANQDDFNVYYSDAYVNGVQDKSVITDDTHISFTTELSTLGEKYVLDYEVTNGSKNYDAELVMECTQGNEYLTITNDFDDETILKSLALRTGKLTLELIKSNAGKDVDVTITCTITANAVERTSIGTADRSQISVEAVDRSDNDLNAKAYQILGEEENTLLNSLVETGYVENVDDVDALIEVTSDEFEDFATTTFDVSSIASEGDKVVILHFDAETQEWEYISEETVNINGEVIADFTSYSPVAFVVIKEDEVIENIYKLIYIDADNSGTITVGDEYTWKREKFNVISQTTNTVTMLARYNIGIDYKQSRTVNKVAFSDENGWAYTPGPKEINIQSYSGPAKTYVNEYVLYLQEELRDNTIAGNLITLLELKKLGCTITDDYAYVDGLTCANSVYSSWLVSNQRWWTRSAMTDYASRVWRVNGSGILGNDNYYYSNNVIRPIITISKSTLN